MPPYTSRHAGQSLRRTPAPDTRFTRDRFTFDGQSGELVACASDLGWGPGVWPKVIVIDDVEYRRDWLGRKVDLEGELLSVTYVPAVAGHPPLTLFND